MDYGSRAGVSVTESSVVGLTAVFRCVSLIANTVAGLPLKTYTDSGEERKEVSSLFDDPGGDLFTPFEFVQLVMCHLLLHGNAFLLHIYTDGGSLAALWPLHPSMVQVRWDPERAIKIYKVTVNGETTEYTDADMTHLMGLSTDGLQGISPIRAMRDSLGASIASNDAAATLFSNGLMVSALVTPAETMSEDDALVVAQGLRAQMTGVRNNGGLAFTNAALTVSPWTMNAEDAQFIESRQMQVSEVARIFGVPVQLLAQDGASSWGSGIQELIIAWVKFTLRGWTAPIEQKLSGLLSNPRFVEFEYKALLQGSPKEELDMLIQQVEAGLLTVDEARSVMNLEPLVSQKPDDAVTQALALAASAPSLAQNPGLELLAQAIAGLYDGSYKTAVAPEAAASTATGGPDQPPADTTPKE